MAADALEAVLRRDRRVVGVALAGTVMLAWAWLAWLAHDMASMSAADHASMSGMHGHAMAEMAMPDMAMQVPPWDVAAFVLAFAMWAVMMVGMMLPSAAPMLLLHARVARQAEVAGRPLAATAVFAFGYVLAWTAFSLAASAGQWALQRALLLDPMLTSTHHVLSGALLVAAGLYQWTPLKRACLHQCQAPWLFLHRHGGFRRDAAGAAGLGLRHGLYCVGCCWALMALLFVGGAMNLLWVAVLAAFVLAEKLLPAARWLPWASGGVLIAAGAWMLTMP